jgi:hypothetical protein
MKVNKEELIKEVTKLFGESLEEGMREFNKLWDKYFYGGGIEKDHPEYFKRIKGANPGTDNLYSRDREEYMGLPVLSSPIYGEGGKEIDKETKEKKKNPCGRNQKNVHLDYYYKGKKIDLKNGSRLISVPENECPFCQVRDTTELERCYAPDTKVDRCSGDPNKVENCPLRLKEFIIRYYRQE